MRLPVLAAINASVAIRFWAETMSRKRSIIRAGAVLVVAVAAGHLVQTMNARKETASKEAEQPKQVEQVAAANPRRSCQRCRWRHP